MEQLLLSLGVLLALIGAAVVWMVRTDRRERADEERGAA